MKWSFAQLAKRGVSAGVGLAVFTAVVVASLTGRDHHYRRPVVAWAEDAARPAGQGISPSVNKYPAKPSAKPVAQVSAQAITPQEWAAPPARVLTPAELDALLVGEWAKAGIKPAPLVDDPTLLRRLSLDLTGQPPTPEKLAAFTGTGKRAANQLEAAVDEMLASEAYARHWARYWRDTLASRVTDRKNLVLAPAFEAWMADQLRDNTRWNQIATAMITAEGEVVQVPAKALAAAAGGALGSMSKYAKDGSAPKANKYARPGGQAAGQPSGEPSAPGGAMTKPNPAEYLESYKAVGEANTAQGAAFLLLSRSGPDAVVDRASEIARVFLGLQLQCAQCHDHPFDSWKREQFHEFAAYMARLQERKFINTLGAGERLTAKYFGEHQMPDLDNPTRSTTIHPKFINGQAAPRGLPDKDRRQLLAREVTDPANPWFAAAYVNRIWAALMGQSFYRPVDDLGPTKEAVMGPVLTHLAASFRASGYDTKALIKLIVTSQAYRRAMRMGATETDHVGFAGVYPTRLAADSLWSSLTTVLGPLDQLMTNNPNAERLAALRERFGGLRRAGQPPPDAPQGAMMGRGMAAMMQAANNPGLMGLAALGGRGPRTLSGRFTAEFASDPSDPPDERDLTVPQALLVMNNAAINARLAATGQTMLAGILSQHSDNRQAVTALYQRVLARTPTANEMARCLGYIAKVNRRGEAFEDIAWSLINSTEFQTKR